MEDPDTLARIQELVIPPAWRDVWICMDPVGHLQATGVDAAGRKQYLYHERWRAHRDRRKFDSMVEFGKSLPRLRERVARDMRIPGRGGRVTAALLTETRVLALAVRLLDLGFFRIGSDDYAERNESYGLTTMLREHVTVAGEEVVFDFPAKSGQRRVQAIADRRVLALLACLKRRRSGSQLLAYRRGGAWRETSADEVNDYIKRLSRGDFTAKDFRTWHATVLAAVELAGAADANGRRARERRVGEAMKTVAAYLGNTPAVCRASYVDPRVIDRFMAGTTIAEAVGAGERHAGGPRVRARIERAVLEMLDDDPGGT